MLAIALMLWTTPPAHGGPVRHALVVGANDGGGVLEPLHYAERDAESIAQILVELGDFDEQLVTVLYAPTEIELRQALAEHASIGERYADDLFLFYYSGHADAAGLRLNGDRYYYETLKHDFRAVESDIRLGILDACRSGSITRLKGATISQSLFGSEGTAAAGEAWITASSPDEVAQESETLRGGFFTHYLLSGMRGAADLNDGIVDLNELYRYTFDEVVSRTGGTQETQHPHFDNNVAVVGQIQVTNLRNATAAIRLPADVSGRIAVYRRPDGLQLAAAAKRQGAELLLAVPAGRYEVRRRSEDDRLFKMEFGVNVGQQVTLDDWGEAELEIASLRGSEARVGHYVDQSHTFERKLNLGQSPAVAGLASLVIPGAGQVYNRQYWRGALYFGVTSALLAGTLFTQGNRLEFASGRVGPPLGLALWGASIADAAYNVRRTEESRPMLGGTLAFTSAMAVATGSTWPYHYGLSADLMLRKGLSIGLDRVGYTPYERGGWDAHVGSRLTLASEGPRWRPGAFLSFGIRHGRVPADTLKITRAVFGVGGNLRYYVVPRYFTAFEARWEQGGEAQGVVLGVGMGVHLGR